MLARDTSGPPSTSNRRFRGVRPIAGSLASGTEVGTYTIERCIGTGAMGEVYKARHRVTDEPVALKILCRESESWERTHPRFLREGEAASRIRHPNVVTITDVGEHQGVPFMAMELLRGETLAERLRREGEQAAPWSVDLILGVCAGVAAAHDRGILHRDLKPENIFLTTTVKGVEHPKVLDFGISKLLDDPLGFDLTQSLDFLGTPFYMSPEQAEAARDVDHRGDQYAIGVILYECMVGQRPHQAHASGFISLVRAIAEGRFAKPRAVNPEIDEEIEAVILRAMAVSPDARYDSVRQLGGALLPYASDAGRSIWQPVFGHEPVVPRDSRPDLVSPERISIALDATVVAHGKRDMVEGIPESSISTVLDTRDETARSPRRLRSLVPGVIIVFLLVAWMVSSQLRGEPQVPTVEAPAPAPANFRVRVNAQPRSALLKLDGQVVGQGSVDMSLPVDGKLHSLRVSADGFGSSTLTFRDAPPPEQIRLEPLPQAPAPSDLVQREAEPQPQPKPRVHYVPRPTRPSQPQEPAVPSPKTDNINPWAR